jgi:hypothetical protein
VFLVVADAGQSLPLPTHPPRAPWMNYLTYHVIPFDIYTTGAHREGFFFAGNTEKSST